MITGCRLVQWDRAAHGRARARPGDDVDCAADRADAVAHPDQTVALANRRLVHAYTVISDCETDAGLVTPERYLDVCCVASVLDGVWNDSFIFVDKQAVSASIQHAMVMEGDNVQLMTIRNHNQQVIEKLSEGKVVLLEQRSRHTYQMVIR